MISGQANEQQCVIPTPQAKFQSASRQAFLWFVAENIADGDRVRIDWVKPGGDLAWSADYGAMTRAPKLCFTTALPIAGFEWAQAAGTWRARVMVNETEVFAREFTLEAPPKGVVAISSAERKEDDGKFVWNLTGVGFTDETTIYVAQLIGNQWRYLETVRPSLVSPGHVSLVTRRLGPGEYFLIGRNFDKTLGSPFPVAIASGGFRLPTPAGVSWQLTQGNSGAFSHYNRTRYAYDLGPLGGTCVVAMRAGVVSAHDQGMGQNLATRTFGNYISIDHGDGYYSHYAHLLTGSFVVKTGQWVEQGQALATVGNSGYSFGRHLHVQITRDPWISAQSVPFQFEDYPSARPGGFVSQNRSTLCDCARPVNPVMVSRSGGPAAPVQAAVVIPKPPPTGRVKEGDWFHQFVTVSPRRPILLAELDWEGAAELDLHLVSPSGQHYGVGGLMGFHSQEHTKPETVRIPNPEPGTWRLSVRGRQVDQGAEGFWVKTSQKIDDAHVGGSN